MSLTVCKCGRGSPPFELARRNDPDPRRFKILRVSQIGECLIVKLKYPDCTNYEGRKILVYRSLTEKRFRRLKSVDPHFCESSRHPSPMARFTPTSDGWRDAVRLCRLLEKARVESLV